MLACQCDVRDPEAIRAAADMCVNELGLPNMIINNAAGNFIAPTERLSCNAFRTVLEIVLHGTAFVILEFGKRLIKSNQGTCVLHTYICRFLVDCVMCNRYISHHLYHH